MRAWGLRKCLDRQQARLKSVPPPSTLLIPTRTRPICSPHFSYKCNFEELTKMLLSQSDGLTPKGATTRSQHNISVWTEKSNATHYNSWNSNNWSILCRREVAATFQAKLSKWAKDQLIWYPLDGPDHFPKISINRGFKESLMELFLYSWLSILDPLFCCVRIH